MDILLNFDFSHIITAMRNSGLALMYIFANFGHTFNQPFVEAFIKIHMPAVYTVISPLLNTMHDVLYLVDPNLADLLFGFSLFDLIGFLVGFIIVLKLWRAIWDAIPVA